PHQQAGQAPPQRARGQPTEELLDQVGAGEPVGGRRGGDLRKQSHGDDSDHGDLPNGLGSIRLTTGAPDRGFRHRTCRMSPLAAPRQGDGHVDPGTGQVAPPVVGPALDGGDGRALVIDPASADGYAHALGPMQILPTTWTRFATLAPGRPAGAIPDPQNAWDA